jgi:chromosome partitioning protein
MKVLALLAQKGGSGKTTVAVHLAAFATSQGQRAALIDLDPQRSSFAWNQSRPEGRRLDAVHAEPGQLAGLLARARERGIDLAICDTAPHSNAEAAIVARAADLVLIPCRPARFDLEAILSTVAIARAANTRFVVVLNAAPRGKLVEEARAALSGKGIAVVPQVLHQRAAYSHAVIDGRAVHEYEQRGQAAAEVAALYHHITGLLGAISARAVG